MRPYKVVGSMIVEHSCDCVYCNNQYEPSENVEEIVYAVNHLRAKSMVLDMFDRDKWENDTRAKAIEVPEGQVFLTDKGDGSSYSDSFTSDHFIMLKRKMVFNTEEAVMRSVPNEKMKDVFDATKPIMPLKVHNDDRDKSYSEWWTCEKGAVRLQVAYTKWLSVLGFEFHYTDNPAAAIVYQGEHVGCLMGCRR